MDFEGCLRLTLSQYWLFEVIAYRSYLFCGDNNQNTVLQTSAWIIPLGLLQQIVLSLEILEEENVLPAQLIWFISLTIYRTPNVQRSNNWKSF